MGRPTEVCLGYDAVVPATPADVKLEPPLVTPVKVPYQTTHVTYVAAKGTASVFGNATTLVTTESSEGRAAAAGKQAFSSIAVHGRNGNLFIYKVFSRIELTDASLAEWFVGLAQVSRHVWQAYPKLEPRPAALAQPFNLGPRGVLAYVQAFEAAVSCMETEVVSAHNAAMMVDKAF